MDKSHAKALGSIILPHTSMLMLIQAPTPRDKKSESHTPQRPQVPASNRDRDCKLNISLSSWRNGDRQRR